MANSFITIKEIARQALPRLMENLVFPNLIHRDFSDDFHYLGDTVRVRMESADIPAGEINFQLVPPKAGKEKD